MLEFRIFSKNAAIVVSLVVLGPAPATLEPPNKNILTSLECSLKSKFKLVELVLINPLSSIFNKVLATENNRNAIQCLNKAIIKNSLSNIFSARLSSNEVYELINGKKFNRMKQNEITDFDFSHVLVDPPRSGLDLNTVNILNNFKNVIYISCNQNTYIRDINLLKSHNIEKIELFDQFPNTKHLEIVSLLHKKN